MASSSEGFVRRQCAYWAKGSCHKGEACTFAHAPVNGTTVRPPLPIPHNPAAGGGNGSGMATGGGNQYPSATRGGGGNNQFRGRGGNASRGGYRGDHNNNNNGGGDDGGSYRGGANHRGGGAGGFRGNFRGGNRGGNRGGGFNHRGGRGGGGHNNGGGNFRGRGGYQHHQHHQHHNGLHGGGYNPATIPRGAYDYAARTDVPSTTAAAVTGEEDPNQVDGDYEEYEGDEGDYYGEGDYEGDEGAATTAAATTPAAGITTESKVVTSATVPSTRRPRVLLGLTGSVATIKARELVSLLAKFADVQVIVTSSARHFFDEPQSVMPASLLDGTVPVLYDQDEYKRWTKMGDPVLHIDLRNWADVLVIAPLSANTLGKLANGLCDNLLTCVARAWDITRPVIVAPAMNTHMWRHPLTPRHIALLRKFLRWRVLMPMIKRLACNEVGQGAMQSIWTVTASVREALGLPVDAALTAAIAQAEATAAAGVAAAQAEAAKATAAAAVANVTAASSPPPAAATPSSPPAVPSPAVASPAVAPV